MRCASTAWPSSVPYRKSCACLGGALERWRRCSSATYLLDTTSSSRLASAQDREPIHTHDFRYATLVPMRRPAPTASAERARLPSGGPLAALAVVAFLGLGALLQPFTWDQAVFAIGAERLLA